jgi:Ser/Thr protein kinase RdoA (MazF antagonist)
VSSEAPYQRLSPELVLGAIETCGYRCDGRFLALASYENRVYQAGTESGYVVAKFYRPGRWSDAAILEEHAFSQALAEREIPVVPPLVIGAQTLHEHGGYRFALFERRGGRWPELATEADRLQMGRCIGRMHAFGAVEPFVHRAALSVERFGHRSVRELLANDWIPAHLMASYESIVAEVLAAVERNFAEAGSYREIRIHGDCHQGNVLWTDAGPHFVDLDDCLMGPAIQDLWLFLSGSREEMGVQLGDLLEGYQQFRDIDYRELRLIEALRALRIIRYTAWIARRWSDPAFPRAFPWFAETKFWEEHVLSLKEQRAALDEPNLSLP